VERPSRSEQCVLVRAIEIVAAAAERVQTLCGTVLVNWLPTWLSFYHTVSSLDWLAFSELVGVVVL
jgi:hypothetical protein